MILKFFGNGSGFTNSHTNAMFVSGGNDLILIDLSMLNLEALLSINPQDYGRIFLYVTHMHDDHISGIGLFVQRMWYVYHKKVILVAPDNLLDSLIMDLMMHDVTEGLSRGRIEDITDKEAWGGHAVSVSHSPGLIDQCYGYIFNIDGKKVVYSGDTNDISPFIQMEMDKFYVDISMNYGRVHVKFEDVLPVLLEMAERGTDIYLMHLDDIVLCRNKIKGLPLRIVETE